MTLVRLQTDRAAETASAVLLGLSAITLWATILVREWPRITALGGICGETGGLGHCAACYVATALTAMAAVALIRLRRTAV